MYRMKPPAGVLDYPISYEMAPGDSIVSSTWAVRPIGAPAEGDLQVKPGSEQVDGVTAACMLMGGVEGRRYQVVNTIATAQGRTDERSMVFRIGPVGVQA